MSCCSQCERQKYDWRERLWSSHSIWGQRNGERGFEPVQITVSLSLLPWLIQLISYSLSFSQLDIAFLFTHSLRLTVPWMVSRIKLASFRTQFVSTSSSEIVYHTAQLLLKWNHWSSFFVKSCQLLLVRCLLRCLRLNKAVTYNVL